MRITAVAALAFALANVAGYSSAETANVTEMTPAQALAVLAPSPGTMAAEPREVAAPADGLISAPPPGRGQVVFFRNTAYYGWDIWYSVKENGRKLGVLSNGAFFAVPVDPGVHVFTAATENKDTLRIEVAAGETYYVRGTIYMGLLLGEASILPSAENSFENVYAHLHAAKTWPANFSPAGDSLRATGSSGGD